jgi:hypothetical protein
LIQNWYVYSEPLLESNKKASSSQQKLVPQRIVPCRL